MSPLYLGMRLIVVLIVNAALVSYISLISPELPRDCAHCFNLLFSELLPIRQCFLSLVFRINCPRSLTDVVVFGVSFYGVILNWIDIRMYICSSHQDAVKINQNEWKNFKSLPTLNPNCKDSMLTLQTDERVSPIRVPRTQLLQKILLLTKSCFQ